MRSTEGSVSRLELLGLPLDAGVTIETVCSLIGKEGGPHLVTFINPGSHALADRDPAYRQMLRQMSLVLPDGQGVASASRVLLGEIVDRISFDMTSLADPFFSALREKGASLMLVGSKPAIAAQVAGRLATRYAGLEIVGTEDGFGDIAPKISNVLRLSPDVVIVAMGAPRQEEFLIALGEAGYRGLAITCGGFFDQHVHGEVYYPIWVDRMNLRAGWRLYKEPRRLWRRYLLDYPVFFWRLLVAICVRSLSRQG